ncbi:Uncharacterised protein [Streptococcus suis]|uniref:hypothetical protein n=1 Tax=Streptococcus suis TaxID=1307 RepID=UPI0005CF1CA8|nr:hypothetical protein [Streptococcus suis]NQI26745.1 hypothetical protein [Streptococcus suis]CYU47469.1 Uncharacterised protein [Streptococcus suis]
MSLKHVKERLKKLVDHTEQGEIICFVFPNGIGGWFVEWNDGESQNKKDGFQSVDEALEFAESLNKVSNIFYHHRETKDTVIIKDEWHNGE